MKKISLKFKDGCWIDPKTGELEQTQDAYGATEEFYYALADDCIYFADDPRNCETILLMIFWYDKTYDEKYIYSYDYAKEAAWVTYRADRTEIIPAADFKRKGYSFQKEGYFRICIKHRKKDGQQTPGVTVILSGREPFFCPKECFENEIEKTVQTVQDNACEQDLTLCLLADTHYTVNGTWEDTVDNLRKVCSRIQPDGIVHLGDFTDGLVSCDRTANYVCKMMDDLESVAANGTGNLHNKHVPVCVTIGNHDSNAFRKNKEPLSKEEMMVLFRMSALYYYIDFPTQKIRCLFLWSDDLKEPVRYGFSKEELDWVERTLSETPFGYRILVFSHEAPLPELDYWARLIRNGRQLLTILDTYNQKEDAHILAYIYGHTHAELLYEECSFPIVSIGCNKCEDYTEKKPRNSKTFHRKIKTVTQDLWDVLQVLPNEDKIYLTRFGAGTDRVIDCRKSKSIWQEEREKRRRNRPLRIWAHRGSSAFAPENTIPAFRVAKELELDGIELDVRLSKDEKPVVIHDETIDRTCDKTGRVDTYTLKELQQMNAAAHFLRFGFVSIPTLQEVLELFRDTDYTICVDVKEEKAVEPSVALVREMGLQAQTVYTATEIGIFQKLKTCVEAKQICTPPQLVNDMDQIPEKIRQGEKVILTDHPGKMRDYLNDRS